jgi:3-oxoacyl-(acyl-carrier-protein) synthase
MPAGFDTLSKTGMSTTLLANFISDNPVLVTGIGSFSAAGDTVESLWQAAAAGKSLAAEYEFKTETENASARFAVCAAPIPDVSPAELSWLRKTDRCVQMAWVAAWQAWGHARLEKAYPAGRIGVIVGSSRGPFNKRNEAIPANRRHRFPPSLAPNTSFGSLSGALAQAFKLKGPGATLSATCASSAFAIALAAEQILLGKVDAMLVGGTEAPLQHAILGQLQSAGVVAAHPNAAQACRPFDTARNGLVLGEGSAFLILESARVAEKRGAVPLARLAGWHVSLDNTGRTGMDDGGDGLLRVMEQALDTAGCTPEMIDYINAHGTGTKLNDETEAKAVAKLLGSRALEVPCSSTKPVTGHCLGATSALEAVICLEALRRQIVPPTANCTHQDPLCPINAQTLTAAPAKISTVMSNSLGFWGYHASLIFSEVSK